MKALSLVVTLFIAFSFAAPIPPQNWYPRVDENSYWILGSFSGGALANANIHSDISNCRNIIA
jgi:hypothetical protein